MSKKEIEDIRSDLHKKIDQIEDEATLHMLQEAAEVYAASPKKDITDELTESQLQRLKESLQQVEEGKTLSHEEVLKKVKEWRSR